MAAKRIHIHRKKHLGFVTFALSLLVFWSAMSLSALVHVSRVCGSENEAVQKPATNLAGKRASKKKRVRVIERRNAVIAGVGGI